MVVTRRQSGKLPTPVKASLRDASDSEGLSEHEDDSDAEPKPKRRRVSRKVSKGKTTKDDDYTEVRDVGDDAVKENSAPVRRRGNAGKLERLNTIPTDIFLEICGHLSPIDVLNLTRTTRAWRAILMSRSSKPIWRAARSTMEGIPDCPEDISEAQYAKLVFERDCYICGTLGVPKSDFALRIRLCKACAKRSVFPQKSFKQHFPIEEETVLQIVPHTNIGAWAHGHESKTNFYYKPAVQEKIYERQEQEAHLGEEDYAEWFASEEVKVEQIRETAAELSQWHAAWLRSKMNDNQSIKKERREAIEKKLLALGYERRDLDWGWPPPAAIETARPLTENSWRLIRSSMERLVQAKRDQRIQREKEEIQRKRQDELMPLYNIACPPTHGAIHPTSMDFFHLPSILPIWVDRTTPIPLNELPDLETVKRELQDCITGIEQDLQRILVNARLSAFPGAAHNAAIPNYPSTPSPEVEQETLEAGELQDPPDLELATSIFCCATCEEALFWPDVLNHRHVRCGKYGGYYGYSAGLEKTVRWNPESVASSKCWIVIMERLLEDLGLPKDTTSAQIKAQNGIQCGQCSFQPGKWSAAFNHVLSKFRQWQIQQVRPASSFARAEIIIPHDPRDTRQKLFNRRASKVRSLPNAANQASGSSSGHPPKTMKCSLCPGSRMFDYAGVLMHLKDKHKINNLEEREQHIIR